MNELEKRARKARKKQKGMSPFTTFSGDPEKNIDAFNHAMGADSSDISCGGACEELSVTQAMKKLDEVDLVETSSKTKAKKLFSEPGKMSYIKTFAIFTSYNPDKKSFPKKDNTAFMKKLKADTSFDTDRYIDSNSQYFSADDIERAVRNGHWHYYRVKGVYDNVEHSLLVYNITLGDAKELSAKYHQQSFIFGTNTDGVLKFEFWANESKKGYSYRKVDERDNFELLDADADNYYTQISRDFKFNIPFEVFEVAADEMVESINKKNERLNWTEEAIMECIEESVNEEITGKYRYYARSTLWNNS